MNKFVLTGLLIGMLAVPVLAQQPSFYAFLGSGDDNAPNKTTPRYGITYNARQFDAPRRRKITVKTTKYLVRRGAGHIVPQFQSFALQMTEDPTAIPKWVDDSWEDIRDKWTACGGTYAQAAQRFNPRSLTILVEPVPFYVPRFNVYAAGFTDGRIIRAVNVNADYLISNPQQASLRQFDQLVKWEIGNALSVFAGYRPRSIEEEVGSRSPCGLP